MEPKRPAALWPPAKKPVRVIIDTDTANEIDDQYALALALGFTDRLRIEGFVAAHFGKSGGPNGIEKSYDEIARVLEKAGPRAKFPVKSGIDQLTSREHIPTSDGIEFIIDTALSATPDDPLYLVLLGPVTDAVAALHREPKIAERLVVFWHVRSEWPSRCRNFNAVNDPVATRWIFETRSRLILFDTGTHLYLGVEESERRYGPINALGKYLATIHRAKYGDRPKAVFDLGDIAALVEPDCARWERVEAPGVDADLNYDFSQKHGDVVRIYDVDKERAFALLEQALAGMRDEERPQPQ